MGRQHSTFVDEKGVLRWTASGAEVVQFGVNYTTPFAHAFRAHRRLGVSHERAIDGDVYHLARLGLDGYRVHVWDREISDSAGNLVANEHVRLFDYLLARLKERGIKIVLTPLQFGDAGYPEAGEPLEGFSSRYGKRGCLEDRGSWPFQERYLAQFVSHVNPYTGLAYKDDPDVIGFEICNEPGHFEYGLTLEYVNRMVQAVRSTGCAAPIFYNMSHGLPVFQAYLDAEVQGGTFQWYPSGLVAGHEQLGNFLPYLDDYPIPFADHPKFRTKAKIVYEFDAADIGCSYVYPAMARTFRKVGVQFAAQFAYDPLALAPFNTEYQTHYLNLAYTPQKALGMMVAAEAFRRIPLYRDYGSYPANTSFEGVRVSYQEDLAELVTDREFLYSNDTATRPPEPRSLERIAGYGDSSVIRYPGCGAYFLDRLEPGVWRLEVMPDAIWVRDPFEKASPRKHVSRIVWTEWPMRIDLPDLGPRFRVVGLNDGNDYRGEADGTTVRIGPGAYLLLRAGATSRWGRNDRFGVIALKEFVAPRASIDRTYVLHTPAREAVAGRRVEVKAKVVSPQHVESVELVVLPPPPRAAEAARRLRPAHEQPGGGNAPGPGGVPGSEPWQGVPMVRKRRHEYSGELPGALLHSGNLRYHIAVRTAEGIESFPSGLAGLPGDWDFYGDPWVVRLVEPEAPILLFDAGTDAGALTQNDREARYELVCSDRPGTTAVELVARDLDLGEHDHSVRFFCRDRIRSRAGDVAAARRVVVFGRSATERACPLQIALVDSDGAAYGGMVTLERRHAAVSIAIRSLARVRAANIPHGYPVFIPFWSFVELASPLDLQRIEAVVLSIGPGLSPADYGVAHGVQVERIWLDLAAR